ncbi:MAG: sll0787 family AIR synthase-like protein [Desulfovibrio sp.]|jgi:AIR synthase-related protein|nr:sll0787 family AIR synthase-like protein [Desulfovibrio sp.]
MGKTVDIVKLASVLRNSEVFRNKRHIGPVAAAFTELAQTFGIRNGDDAAALPDGEGYLLLAAEGIVTSMIRLNPYFAGRCAVLANVNDIYAMGGRPLAMVNVIGSPDAASTKEIVRGMRDGAMRYRVPIVGGHVLRTTDASSSVALAILGRAKRLMTSFDAHPGDHLMLATRTSGRWLADMGYWNCTLPEDDSQLPNHLELLPQAAEAGFVRAGKDVSMAGIAGTTAMLAESSGIGAEIDLDALTPPPGAALARWMLAFMSYGFLLAVPPANKPAVVKHFSAHGVSVKSIGGFREGHKVVLRQGAVATELWDFAAQPFAAGGAL